MQRLNALLILACSLSHCLLPVLYAESNESVTESSSEIEEWLAHKQFFEEHGYLWIKNFFSPEQVKLLQCWADEIHQTSETLLTLCQMSGKPVRYIMQNIPQAPIVVPEATNSLQACRTEDLLSCYPDLHHFIQGTVSSYIGSLLGESYVLFKDKINFKWPGGGAFLAHQDFPAYELFGPREHVTAMVCIDPATLENGCLQIAANWKELYLEYLEMHPEVSAKDHVVLPYILGGKEHGSIKPEYVEKMRWLELETSPRDLVIFNSFLPHYSEPNNSQTPRRAMFLTHNKLSDGDHRKAYYHAKRNDPDNPVFHIGTPTKARGK